MSSNLMDTSPGGEQTQYESVHTFVDPHAKQAGQLGGTQPLPPSLPSSLLHPIRPNPSHPNHEYATNLPTPDPAQGTDSPTSLPKHKTNEPNTQGVTPADKIRYGQSIQEGGMGGKTNASGEASQDGGFGGTEAKGGDEEGAAKARREQGYGGESEMDTTIGG
ncbi:hypothetical protein P153DRAFT_287449 [Dothidotthia symphoricarpi CBS 119687]|uniref:Uncharacterized protein n=1 Tax=Dothidotthia symphoricarpi CBS 119687 TaxID=1392245 RepID=A0A6A6AJJ5_9PLEO|nr:uncharacterized protein P153DRAFT_287449 [Dothidotthia symphoricarpi CBS 119687]KAF2131047.1 hypothetical protein P153DRAFT_287449 [Dothidotthia symphoricarpi CBS 119687]